MEPYLSKIEQLGLKLSEISMEVRPLPVSITVFKVDDRLFGVESKKIFKLFKVPNIFHEKYINLQKIRLRDFEVKMINLKKLLSIQGGEPKGEMKILMVKGNGEYKGLMIDQVLEKLSATSDKKGEFGEYFSGIVHSTYEEQPVEIPILDLRKF
jgi:chemotaxis signal transduction protein